MMEVLGALVILVGVGLAGQWVYVSRSDWVIAVVVLLLLLVLGAMMVSRGGYARKQDTPMGRVEDAREA